MMWLFTTVSILVVAYFAYRLLQWRWWLREVKWAEVHSLLRKRIESLEADMAETRVTIIALVAEGVGRGVELKL